LTLPKESYAPKIERRKKKIEKRDMMKEMLLYKYLDRQYLDNLKKEGKL
jgi:hypothetical protein